jgi:hypothetical protein
MGHPEFQVLIPNDLQSPDSPIHDTSEGDWIQRTKLTSKTVGTQSGRKKWQNNIEQLASGNLRCPLCLAPLDLARGDKLSNKWTPHRHSLACVSFLQCVVQYWLANSALCATRGHSKGGEIAVLPVQMWNVTYQWRSTHPTYGMRAATRLLYVCKAIKKWRNFHNLANSKAIEWVRFSKSDYLNRIVWGPYDVETETAHIIENLTDQLSEIYWHVISFLNGIRLDIDRRQTFLNEHFQRRTVKPVKRLSSNARHDDRILLSKVRPMPFFVFWGISLNFWRALSLHPMKWPSMIV